MKKLRNHAQLSGLSTPTKAETGRETERERDRQTDRGRDRGRDREVYATLSSTTAPGASSLKAESGLHLTASKKARTSVLHPQGIKFCQQK